MTSCGGAVASSAALFDVAVFETAVGEALVGCGVLEDPSTCEAAALGASVFVPQGAPLGGAAVVLGHRGSYEVFSPCRSCVDAALARYLAARGVTVVSVRYRLRGDRGHAAAFAAAARRSYRNKFENAWVADPAAMYAATRDLRAGVRWARRAGFDCVVAAGTSAGATSALALGALAAREDAYASEAPRDPTTPWANYSNAVAGAAAVHGTVDAVDLLGESYWAAGTGAPLLLVHGDADGVNDVRNSEWVAAHYNGSATLVVLEGQPHKLRDAALEAAFRAIVDWLPETGLGIVDGADAFPATALRGALDAAIAEGGGAPVACGDAFEPLCGPEDPPCGGGQLHLGGACYGARHGALVAAGLVAAGVALGLARRTSASRRAPKTKPNDDPS